MTHRKKLSEFAGLEVELPRIELPEPIVDIASDELQHDTHDINDTDDEGAMMKADLYKLAKYSVKLFKKIEAEDQFESWVQAKITKAADYISSVYHYLEYEMKFSEYGDKIENSDMYSESEKRQMKNALMEAKKSLAALKIKQADKLKPLSEATRGSKPEVNFTKDDLTSLRDITDLNTLKTRALDLITTPSKHPVSPDLVNYSKNALEKCKTPAAVIIFMYNMMLGGEGLAVIGTRHGMDASHYRKSRGGLKDPGEFKEGFNEVCSACGGAGHVEKKIPEATKVKVEKYNRQAKAFSAASKRLDKNKNGIPDDMESDAGGEEFTTSKKSAPKKGTNPFAKKDDSEKDDSKSKNSAPKKGTNPFAKKDKDSDSESDTPKKSAPKKDSSKGENPFAKKSATKKDDAKTESMFGGSVYGESVTPVKKPSGVADKKGGNPFAKKDDAKKEGGKEFGKALAKAKDEWNTVKESAKEKAKKDYDNDGKTETSAEEHRGVVDKAIKSAKDKECMNESVELTRLRELTLRVIR